jgi:4'-phosphopantetheinyl transferase EntD
VIERLLPAAVISVEAFGDLPGEVPFPGEEDLIAKAVEVRRREFVTARRCAREALAKLGIAPAPIRRGRRGDPQWPAGVIGSITHCAGYRAAAVARAGEPVSLGIDAEPHDTLPDGVRDMVTVAEERDMLARLAVVAPGVHWDRLLFSAKESIFKAWYPLTRRELDFDEARLDFDPAAGTFTARLSADGTRTDNGPPLTGLSGRFLVDRGVVATAVVVPR